MTQACPAAVGQSLDEIETPALLVDLDAYERNLKRMARALEGRAVRLRPHAKTHKSPEIALDQMAHGAVGVCCQKVGEAEVLVAGGVPDVLVSNQVVGGSKIARLVALAGEARLSVCVDDARNVAELSAVAAKSTGVVSATRVSITPAPCTGSALDAATPSPQNRSAQGSSPITAPVHKRRPR